MVKRFEVSGYDSLMKLTDEISRESKKIFVLFCGNKNDKGKSWCPDCLTAEPVVEEALKKVPEDSVFISCSVGDRTSWKDPNNAFRKAENLNLKFVPTLLLWNSPKRLEEKQCENPDLVTMLFQDED